MFAVLLTSPAYRIMALLHILSAVMAFGPMLLYPGLRKAGETATIARLHMRMTFPALVALWVLGMGLAGMSEDAYTMSQLWLALSLVLWAMLMAVSWFLIRPSISDTSESANTRLAAGTGVMHLGLVVGLALMIWKPGL
jgi:ABC-type Na+ efflux pump permease subunit